MMNYYLMKFRGISCPGCVTAIDNKVKQIPKLTVIQFSDTDGSIICTTEMEEELIIPLLASFQGCCSNCQIYLDSIDHLTAEELPQIDIRGNDQYQLVKTQYKKALQRALSGQEVACSEFCVCKTTNINRIDEFQEAPSFASVYNLTEYLEDYLKEGMTIVDFGSGTGHDILRITSTLSSGSFYGIDITPEMINHARSTAEEMEIENVKFMIASDMASIEDQSCDLIYTNNVFNILEDQAQFVKESHSKLNSNGRLVIADEVAKTELPDGIKTDPNYQCGGIAGANSLDTLINQLNKVGFQVENIIDVRDYAISYQEQQYQMTTTILILQKDL